MAVEWVAPHTWATSEEVTAARLNQVRDQLQYLFDHASLTGFDLPHTSDPRLTAVTANVGSANNCHYNRIYHGGTLTAIRIRVITSSGNIGVAVYDQTGDGASAVPNARLDTSGSVACPAAGMADVALGGSVTVGHGLHWFALSASGTTATFLSASAILASWTNGVNAAQTTAHPPPDPASPTATASQLFVQIGV
jgi:hypothetical protein